MTGQQNGGHRRIWSAAEKNQQLDEVAEALIQGSHEFVRGFLFGPGPSRRQRPRPKPQRPEKPEERKS